MAIKGLDLSHHNNVTDWNKARKGYEFCFIKCTQGTGYLDPTYKARKEQVRKAGFLFGAYHFANADTDPAKEADWFLKNVGELKEGEIVVLDYETYALPNPAEWCRKWLDRVESKLGFKPLLYTYHGLLTKYDWKRVSEGNFGLWAARYGLQTTWPNPLFKPSTGSWPFYAIWQYCSKGKVNGIVGNVDLNTTDMSIETLRKYGKKKELTCNHQCPVHCD